MKQTSPQKLAGHKNETLYERQPMALYKMLRSFALAKLPRRQ
jgi:hypothetical protein